MHQPGGVSPRLRCRYTRPDSRCSGSPRSGRHCISLAALAPGCGAVTRDPILGVPAAREAGGIASAWRRQPQVAVPLHATRFSVFRQPAERAALHQPGGISPRLLCRYTRPNFRCSGSPRSGRHCISLVASAPGSLAAPFPPATFGIHPAREAGGIASAWRRQPQAAVPSRPAPFPAFTQPAKRAALHEPGGVSPRFARSALNPTDRARQFQSRADAKNPRTPLETCAGDGAPSGPAHIGAPRPVARG